MAIALDKLQPEVAAKVVDMAWEIAKTASPPKSIYSIEEYGERFGEALTTLLARIEPSPPRQRPTPRVTSTAGTRRRR
jgi:hypothetical protein